MSISTISWHKNSVRIIDQTLLPQTFKYVYCRDIKTLWNAIKTLQVRGAPALGVAGAFGILLGIKDFKGSSTKAFIQKVNSVARYLSTSRPTAVNLFNELNAMVDLLHKNSHLTVIQLKKLLHDKALSIYEADRSVCRKMGGYGASLIKNGHTIMTICNAGALATVDYGTALGVMYSAKAEKKKFSVYACETRPLLQGARLTAWELMRSKIDVTLICDNMAASVMKQKKINGIFAGADRIAMNGDAANKIGTYNLAVLAKYHQVPFYIVAPLSTFDVSITSGKEIPIELRDKNEVTSFGLRKTSPDGVKVYNPAFDVTDQKLITAIITEVGIIKPPFKTNIKKAFAQYAKKNNKE